MINKWIARSVATLFAMLMSIFAHNGELDAECWIGLFIFLIGLGLGWIWPKIGAAIFFIIAGLLASLALIAVKGWIVIGIAFIILIQGILFLMTKTSTEKTGLQP
jgi:hypothetical protein